MLAINIKLKYKKVTNIDVFLRIDVFFKNWEYWDRKNKDGSGSESLYCVFSDGSGYGFFAKGGSALDFSSGWDPDPRQLYTDTSQCSGVRAEPRQHVNGWKHQQCSVCSLEAPSTSSETAS